MYMYFWNATERVTLRCQKKYISLVSFWHRKRRRGSRPCHRRTSPLYREAIIIIIIIMGGGGGSDPATGLVDDLFLSDSERQPPRPPPRLPLDTFGSTEEGNC